MLLSVTDITDFFSLYTFYIHIPTLFFLNFYETLHFALLFTRNVSNHFTLCQYPYPFYSHWRKCDGHEHILCTN